MSLRWATLLLVLAPLAGCVETQNRRALPPNQKPPAIPPRPIPGVNAPLPDEWVRVFVGQLPRPKLCGYMRIEHVADDGGRYDTHWVYDSDFQLIGNISANGRTVRFDRFGKSTSFGVLPVNQGLLALYGYTTIDPNTVRYVSMPAPKE